MNLNKNKLTRTVVLLSSMYIEFTIRHYIFCSVIFEKYVTLLSFIESYIQNRSPKPRKSLRAQEALKRKM
jgi:uncharacterized membrane protein